MKKNSLKNCIGVLVELRRATASQLDAGVLLELDTVIAELTKISESQQGDVHLGTLGVRTLEVIARIMVIVDAFKDLIR